MATLNISLPDSMRDFIEQELNQNGYTTASDYLGDLVREQQRRRAQEKFEFLILEGGQCGVDSTPEYLAQLKSDFLSNRAPDEATW